MCQVLGVEETTWWSWVYARWIEMVLGVLKRLAGMPGGVGRQG